MTRKRIIALALALCMLAVSLSFTTTAADVDCGESYTGTNVEAQDYGSVYPWWSSTVKSYLVPTDDGFMRVQAGSSIDGVLVEYYGADYSIQRGKTKLIAEELPIFGGFYAADDAYYVLTGQNNTDEDNSVEVFRVTKYDKNWNRLGSDGLYGANTTKPFNAGSARMEVYGNYLLIRTSHEMYKYTDGVNHQANVTIQFNTQTMKITASATAISNNRTGYVSHSFNQFIHVENGHIIALDHGDASPRSAVLMIYPTDVTSGSFTTSSCRNVNVLEFASSASNYNKTGASVGALEISGSSYLVAGNSVVQSGDIYSSTTTNVFVGAVDKTTYEVSVNWLTSYAEGDGRTSTPQMVKISDDRFLVLWSRNSVVYYTEVNGSGKTVSETHKLTGALSDCAPVVRDGKVVWYTWQNENVTFYEISVSDISVNSKTTVKSGHDYELESSSGGVATLKCRNCGKTVTVGTYTSYTLYWEQTPGAGSYSNAFPTYTKYVGDNVKFWLMGGSYPDGYELNRDWTVEISDESVMSYTFTSTNQGYITGLKPGTVTVKIYPKYNPSVSRSVTVTIHCVHENGGSDVTELVDAKDATCTETGYTGDLVCTVCGEVIEEGSVIPKKPHEYQGGQCIECGADEPEYILGDANGDGAVDNADALAIFRYVFDNQNPIVFEAADVNLDRAVDNADALAIFKYIFDSKTYPLG